MCPVEVVEVVLVQCNLLDNQYQQKSEVSYTFNPNKSYVYLLIVEPSNFRNIIILSLMKLSQHLRILMLERKKYKTKLI